MTWKVDPVNRHMIVLSNTDKCAVPRVASVNRRFRAPERVARLIAAAPEQHEALIEGRAVIAGAINEYGSHPAWEHALKVMDTAIAKARGEA